jgi:hypothetical protein
MVTGEREFWREFRLDLIRLARTFAPGPQQETLFRMARTIKRRLAGCPDSPVTHSRERSEQ